LIRYQQFSGRRPSQQDQAAEHHYYAELYAKGRGLEPKTAVAV